MERWTRGVRVMLAIGAIVITGNARAQADGAAQPTPRVAGAIDTKAPSGQSAFEAQLLTWLATQIDDWGRRCNATSLLRYRSSYYVACGAAGVWTVAPKGGAYAVTEQRDVGRPAIAFVMDPEGYVFLRLQGNTEGEPDSLAPMRGMRVGPPSTDDDGRPVETVLQQIEVRGTVTGARGLNLTIDLGTRDGLRKRDHIRFVVGESHVVGVVRKVDNARSQVGVGLNEAVHEGAGAVISREPTTGSIVAPPLPTHTWHMGATLRPVLGSGDVGLILDAFLGMRPLRHLSLDVRLAPAAFSFSRGLERGNFRTYGMVSGEFRWFSAGFGVGLERAGNLRELLPILAQRVVLGAQDGLHLRLAMSSALDDGGFRISSFAPSIQVPFMRSASALLGMFVGYGGPIYLETGVRALVAGNGNADSAFLRFTAGIATASFDSSWTPGGGPHVGVGFEYRL